MNRSSLSRELALRIGLAARALPDTSPKLFVSVLRACAGPVLDERKIAQLGEAQLQQALGNFGVKADAGTVRNALGLLQSPATQTQPAPQPRLADLPGSILVAVAATTRNKSSAISAPAANFWCTRFRPAKRA